LYCSAVAKRFDQEKREREEQQRREERARREEIARLRNEEQARLDKLRSDASNWHEAQRIRSYLSAVRDTAIKKFGVIQPGSESEEWLIWAEDQAERLDPLTKSPP